MTERGSRSLKRTETSITIGPSGLTWKDGRLIIDLDEWTVPLPRRLRGRMVIEAAHVYDDVYALDENQRHSWRPIAPCATVAVSFERPALNWRGRAYLDMNYGSEPLEDGFRRWIWSRENRGNASRILYDVERRNGSFKTLSLAYAPDGTVEHLPALPISHLPRTGWRVSRSTRASIERPARVMRTLEDTPFYSRSLLAGGDLVAPSLSIHESVDLDRFRSRWVQVLLPFKMPRRSR